MSSSVRGWFRRAALQSGRALRWTGRLLLSFLDLVGLLEQRKVEQEAQFARFKLHHSEFRKLLTANNDFLEDMAELEDKLHGGGFFDPPWLKRRAVGTVVSIQRMAGGINVISSGRYAALQPVFERIAGALGEAIRDIAVPQQDELVLDMSALTRAYADVAGGKMANLSEIRNALGLPTPDGFALTTEACRLIFDEAGVNAMINTGQIEEILAEEGVGALGERLRAMILGAGVPPRVRDALLAAHNRLAARLGAPPLLAVRSSAPGEDTAISFAGQFDSILNVTRDGLPSACLKVIASLFSPEAIHYRMLHGVRGESAAMAVGCIAMVDAAASGIVFSNDPNHPEPGNVLIHAVRGLGVTLADGRTSPEEIVLSRGPGPRVISRAAARQAARVVCRDGTGVAEEQLGADEAAAPVVTDAEAARLARWALGLEAHFGAPQDIEWAMDARRRLVLLQSRPLRISGPAPRTATPAEGPPLILSGGETACPGVGAGIAVRMDEDGDFDSFPDGGVLVARRSSPKFVRLMPRAKAIVTDAGSTTGHMASLAREFGVPALLNTKNATRLILPGAPVTVDATNGFVYSGEVPGLESRWAAEKTKPAAERLARWSPAREALEKIVALTAPLNLTSPRSPSFRIENCRTLHDMARFIHEKSFEEMFRMGESLGDFKTSSWYLDVFLPIDLYIIDVGGGIAAPSKGRKVKPSQVLSVPLGALLRGMLHEKIQRFGPRPLDLGGFMSLMMRHALTSPENTRTFRDPCYAITSKRYLNYTARVGYHFGVVDTYCSETVNKNYINMMFRGGAADIVRRSRRANVIAGILRESGFSVEVNRDTVNARISKAPQEETETCLDMIGRLLQFMRQMDLAMATNDSAKVIGDAFLEGDYGLERIGGKRRSVGG